MKIDEFLPGVRSKQRSEVHRKESSSSDELMDTSDELNEPMTNITNPHDQGLVNQMHFVAGAEPRETVRPERRSQRPSGGSF